MGCNCGDNEYNITVNNNGNCEPTTPIYNITLANVGVNGYSPIVSFINETVESFNISVDNITGMETSPAVPKLSYVIDQINSVNNTIGELGNTYLTINGSNAANILNLNNLRLTTNDDTIQRVMASNGTQLRVSGQGLVLDGYAQAGQVRPNSITISPTGSSITIGNTHETRHNIILDNTGAFYDSNEIATINDIPDITTKLNTNGGNATNNFTVNGVELAGNYVYINNVSYGGINISQTNSDIYAKLEVDSSNARLTLPNLVISSGVTSDVILNTTKDFVINRSNTDIKTYYHGTSSNNEIATKGDLPTVGNGTITLTQGGVTKGTFTTNQSGDTTIEFDEGGSNLTAGDGIVITNDEVSIDSKYISREEHDTYNTVVVGDGNCRVRLFGDTARPYYQTGIRGTALALYTDIPDVNNPTITFTQGGTTKGSITLNQSNDTTINLDDVGNGTITLTQGGVTKGTFTVNQNGNTTIELDEGGSGGTVDQTFNPTSTHAQSGKAVAEAISTKQDLLTSENAGTNIEIVNGAGGDDTISGNGSILLEKAVANGLNSVTVSGGCEQSATPSPSNPIPIVCNNGELKVSKNLVKAVYSVGLSASKVYQFGSMTPLTNTYTTTAAWKGVGAFVPVVAGKTYTRSGSVTNAGYKFTSFYANFSDIGNYTKALSTVTTTTFTVPSGASYAVVGWITENTGTKITFSNIQVELGSTATEYLPYGEVYTEGITELVTDSLNNTATAERLLAIGDYKDTQEILSGAVNRKVGVIVLDGTENWELYATNNGYRSFRVNNFLAAKTKVGACTHLPYYDFSSSAMDRECVAIGSNKTTFYINLAGEDKTVNDLKAWLQSQYSAGTPVIVVYPLATETTETVTGQTLTTIQGDNTLTISQASINNLPIEANYNLQGGTIINFTGTIPTVNDATITITQGGVTKGTFTTNQSGNATINLDSGGSGGGAVDSVNGQTGTVVLTASDVGALADTVTIPTQTSDLTNDSGFITSSALSPYTLTSSLATVATSGSYNDLINKPVIPTVTSDLTNDSGYITTSDLNGYATESWVGNQGYLTNNITQSVTIQNGNSLLNTNSRNIVSSSSSAIQVGNTIDSLNLFGSALRPQYRSTNMASFVDLALATDVPTNNNQLTNGAGYITGITSSDVTTALGYTPVDKAGDTMTGGLTVENDYITIQSPEAWDSTPSTQLETGINFTNNNGDRLGYINCVYGTNSARLARLNTRNADGSQNTFIEVGYNSSGNAYCTFPNTTCCDGEFVKSSVLNFANNISVESSSNTDWSKSVSTYLPNDGKNYEILVTGYVTTGSTSGNYAPIEIYSDICDLVKLCRAQTRVANTAQAAGAIWLPVGTNRTIYVRRNSSWVGTFSLDLRGYRRIGTNS